MSDDPFGRYTFFKAGDLVRIAVPVRAFKYHVHPVENEPLDPMRAEKVFPAGTIARLVNNPDYARYLSRHTLPNWITEFLCDFDGGYSVAVHMEDFRRLSPLEQLALEAE